MRSRTLPLCLCSLLVLAACQPPPQDPATRSEPDTKPVSAQRATAPSPAPAEATIEAAEPGIPLEHSAQVAAPPADAAAASTLVREYYAAINAKDYARAYGMWSEQGKASGQSAEQFANGYASTERVQADIGVPGNAEGAAGSRYLQVPVTVHSVRSGGEQRTFAGHFVLRAVVADGAPASARQWHLYSAELQRKLP